MRTIFVAITMAALGAVGITTAIMSSVTPAHAQQGVGGECHITGKPGVLVSILTLCVSSMVAIIQDHNKGPSIFLIYILQI